MVIGNSNYHDDESPYFCQLSEQGPVDAETFSDALGECNFDTTLMVNAEDAKMDESFTTLANATKSGDVAVIFFGGHAIERNGETYLFGIRADREGLPSAGVGMSWLFSIFPTDALLLLFVDSCRNTYVQGKNQTERGLKQDDFFGTIPAPGPVVPPSSWHLTSWSTQRGEEVPDGEAQMHSPYVTALMNGIEEGLALPALLAEVTSDVALRTHDVQTPCVDDPHEVLSDLAGSRLPMFVFFD